MSKTSVCGFFVLRKPEMNFDELERAGFLPPGPHINDKYYGGVDRMPWFDIDEEDSANPLPEDLEKLWKEVEEHNQPYLDFCLVTDINKAKILLEYSNRSTSRNELVAIYLKKLSDLKGAFNSNADMVWLGVDIDCSGSGPQISQGIFKAPPFFS
jgi:hypothetical protein